MPSRGQTRDQADVDKVDAQPAAHPAGSKWTAMLSFLRWLDSTVEKGWGALNSPQTGPISLIILCGVVLLAQMLGYHEAYLPWYPDGLEIPPSWKEPTLSSLFYHYLVPYLKLIGMLSTVVFHLALMRSFGSPGRLIVPLWLVSGFLLIWLVMADQYEHMERLRHLSIGQPYSPWAFTGKAVAMAVMILAPAIGLTYYQTRTTWEKYVLRNVAQPLAFCLLSIATIVVLIDLQDNLKEFSAGKVPGVQIFGFYANLLPHIFVEAATPSLVMAVLFGLLAMVKANELVALLNTGLSLGQIVRPVLIVAAFACLISMAANYHLAPTAEGERQATVLGLRKAKGGAVLKTNVMHHLPEVRRTWYIGIVPYNLREEKLRQVEVHEFDAEGQTLRSIHAPTARWWPEGVWSFYRGHVADYKDGTVVKTTPFGATSDGGRLDHNWKENPWDILVPGLNPNDMGVPEMAAYLEKPGMIADPSLRKQYVAEMLHRVSYPWHGLCLVIFSIPLICRTGRQAAMSAAGMVIAAFVVNHFLLNNVAIKLARSEMLSPGWAAWMPHLVVGVPGVLLLWWRSSRFALPEWTFLATDFRWKNRWRIIRGRYTRPWSGRRHRASWLIDVVRSL
jgi:lipopolysaccharide export LptBFGC system permease protein LptF